MAQFVKGLGDTINAVFTPKKQTPEVPPAAQMNATLDTDTRKRKSDVYDDFPGGEDADDASQSPPGTAKTRKTNNLYAPVAVPLSANRVKRRGGRLSSASQVEVAKAIDPRVDAEANLERARAPDAARLQPDEHDQSSVVAAVPEADMGGGDIEFFGTPAKSKAETASSSPTKPKPTQNETEPEIAAVPEEPATEDVRKEEEGDVAEVHALIDHKMLDDKSVDLLVHWEGEPVEEATWEPEAEIQEGASELLFTYWKKAGGRDSALFKTEAEVYHVFRILNHEKKPRGGFALEVQWVGYPASKGNTTWEAETRVKSIAPELLEEYWESVGGRSSFLSKRGRTKKN